jgi:hypothetical protein
MLQWKSKMYYSFCVWFCGYLWISSFQCACAFIYYYLWPVPYFLTLYNKRHFQKKKNIKHKMYVFIFSKYFSETSLILWSVQPDVKNAHMKYSPFFSYFHGTSIFWSDFWKNNQISYFKNIRAVEQSHSMRMSERADRHDEACRYYANAANK